MPDEPLMHFHRIGRTAIAGREGVALSLVNRNDEPELATIRSMTSSSIIEIDGTSRLGPAAGSAGFRAREWARRIPSRKAETWPSSPEQKV